ncbi:magnesium/cobalt transporter CorA [Solidesulfovibrio sp.]|uniref:magnesium/cobalt transporter CorA n=1 Tax=Solidesulfovibrio sp. TaxID=2910990 RepID=UPI002623470B|nr:magnesium/cobalt transporter CorA [Solidesulfovibrio sp.]
MLERFKRRVRGTADAEPGESAFPERQTFTPYVLVYSYDATSVTVRRYDKLGEGEPEVVSGKVNWVRVVGVHDEAFVREVGKRFCLHPLLVDDVLATGHRPAMEEYDSGIFVLLRLLGYDESAKRVLAEQVCIVASDGYVLTFQEREANLWDALAARLEKGGGKLAKRGREHLTYSLIAAILDDYILTLGRLAEDIEELEQTILSGGGADTLTETYRLKREVLFLHRSLWPLREVLGRYMADESNTADPGVAFLWNDIRQDVYQVLDAVETLREMLSEMVGLSMTKAELRMNAVGQYLTLVATIFLPLNFLVGFFGMNFDNLPLKSEQWGIYALMGMMGLTIIGMTLYFYRKHWIDNTKVD